MVVRLGDHLQVVWVIRHRIPTCDGCGRYQRGNIKNTTAKRESRGKLSVLARGIPPGSNISCWLSTHEPHRKRLNRLRGVCEPGIHEATPATISWLIFPTTAVAMRCGEPALATSRSSPVLRSKKTQNNPGIRWEAIEEESSTLPQHYTTYLRHRLCLASWSLSLFEIPKLQCTFFLGNNRRLRRIYHSTSWVDHASLCYKAQRYHSGLQEYDVEPCHHFLHPYLPKECSGECSGECCPHLSPDLCWCPGCTETTPAPLVPMTCRTTHPESRWPERFGQPSILFSPSKGAIAAGVGCSARIPGGPTPCVVRHSSCRFVEVAIATIQEIPRSMWSQSEVHMVPVLLPRHACNIWTSSQFGKTIFGKGSRQEHGDNPGTHEQSL